MKKNKKVPSEKDSSTTQSDCKAHSLYSDLDKKQKVEGFLKYFSKKKQKSGDPHIQATIEQKDENKIESSSDNTNVCDETNEVVVTETVQEAESLVNDDAAMHGSSIMSLESVDAQGNSINCETVSRIVEETSGSNSSENGSCNAQITLNTHDSEVANDSERVEELVVLAKNSTTTNEVCNQEITNECEEDVEMNAESINTNADVEIQIHQTLLSVIDQVHHDEIEEERKEKDRKVNAKVMSIIHGDKLIKSKHSSQNKEHENGENERLKHLSKEVSELERLSSSLSGFAVLERLQPGPLPTENESHIVITSHSQLQSLDSDKQGISDPARSPEPMDCNAGSVLNKSSGINANICEDVSDDEEVQEVCRNPLLDRCRERDCSSNSSASSSSTILLSFPLGQAVTDSFRISKIKKESEDTEVQAQSSPVASLAPVIKSASESEEELYIIEELGEEECQSSDEDILFIGEVPAKRKANKQITEEFDRIVKKVKHELESNSSVQDCGSDAQMGDMPISNNDISKEFELEDGEIISDVESECEGENVQNEAEETPEQIISQSGDLLQQAVDSICMEEEECESSEEQMVDHNMPSCDLVDSSESDPSFQHQEDSSASLLQDDPSTHQDGCPIVSEESNEEQGDSRTPEDGSNQLQEESSMLELEDECNKVFEVECVPSPSQSCVLVLSTNSPDCDESLHAENTPVLEDTTADEAITESAAARIPVAIQVEAVESNKTHETSELTRITASLQEGEFPVLSITENDLSNNEEPFTPEFLSTQSTREDSPFDGQICIREDLFDVNDTSASHSSAPSPAPNTAISPNSSSINSVVNHNSIVVTIPSLPGTSFTIPCTTVGAQRSPSDDNDNNTVLQPQSVSTSTTQSSEVSQNNFAARMNATVARENNSALPPNMPIAVNHVSHNRSANVHVTTPSQLDQTDSVDPLQTDALNIPEDNQTVEQLLIERISQITSEPTKQTIAAVVKKDSRYIKWLGTLRKKTQDSQVYINKSVEDILDETRTPGMNEVDMLLKLLDHTTAVGKLAKTTLFSLENQISEEIKCIYEAKKNININTLAQYLELLCRVRDYLKDIAYKSQHLRLLDIESLLQRLLHVFCIYEDARATETILERLVFTLIRKVSVLHTEDAQSKKDMLCELIHDAVRSINSYKKAYLQYDIVRYHLDQGPQHIAGKLLIISAEAKNAPTPSTSSSSPCQVDDDIIFLHQIRGAMANARAPVMTTANSAAQNANDCNLNSDGTLRSALESTLANGTAPQLGTVSMRASMTSPTSYPVHQGGMMPMNSQSRPRNPQVGNIPQQVCPSSQQRNSSDVNQRCVSASNIPPSRRIAVSHHAQQGVIPGTHPQQSLQGEGSQQHFNQQHQMYPPSQPPQGCYNNGQTQTSFMPGMMPRPAVPNHNFCDYGSHAQPQMGIGQGGHPCCESQSSMVMPHQPMITQQQSQQSMSHQRQQQRLQYLEQQRFYLQQQQRQITQMATAISYYHQNSNSYQSRAFTSNTATSIYPVGTNIPCPQVQQPQLSAIAPPVPAQSRKQRGMTPKNPVGRPRRKSQDAVRAELPVPAEPIIRRGRGRPRRASGVSTSTTVSACTAASHTDLLPLEQMVMQVGNERNRVQEDPANSTSDQCGSSATHPLTSTGMSVGPVIPQQPPLINNDAATESNSQRAIETNNIQGDGQDSDARLSRVHPFLARSLTVTDSLL